MLSKESGAPTFDLPDEVLQLLPSDPFQQLDIARKITSIALSTRVSSLESEASSFRAQLADRDQLIADLQAQLDSLDASLSDAADKLARADQEKESLLRDNASLTNTVRKLQRDVSKLEVFRRTLMQSLQEDEDGSAGVPHIIAKPTPSEDDVCLLPSRTSSMHSQFSEVGNPFVEDRATDASRPGYSLSLLLASQTSTPRVTPPASPPSLSASVSPTRTSKPASPRRHSISFSSSRGMSNDRSFVFSSQGSETPSGRTRVDGKEFFRLVRTRLSYEQFGAFLANVKELNSHKQSKEETLRKAEEIFRAENKDLYAIFEGLITRNAQN